jgi:hypothetical protein
MVHPASATFTNADAAVAYAEAFIAESNGAAFAGIPATGFVIFENAGLYGTTYEVSFTAPFSVVAGTIFAEAA